ncbi:MAG: DUF4276 family protein [Armatimonadetes bacterium]|nr:DUF4276 family protein [Armatimonadota bacterium]
MEVFVFVEGQTEETFVKRLLGPHLAEGDVFLTPRKPGKPARSGRRGYGVPPYAVLKRDLARQLRGDARRSVRIATMLDLYRLPSDYPGHASASSDPHERARHIEAAMREDVGDGRFLPYLQVHEFEALLFVQAETIAVAYPGREAEAARLAQETAGFANPELIDNGPLTHPSARILAAIPEYNKPTGGTDIALQIGLERMRERCPHFAEWLAALEALTEEGNP